MLFSGQALQLQVTFVLCADHACENCLCQGRTEERQTKQHQNFLAEGKVGGASVACTVSLMFTFLPHSCIP